MKKILAFATGILIAFSWEASAQVLTGAQVNFNSSISGYSGTGVFGDSIVALSIGNGVPNPATFYSLGDGVSISFTAPGALNGTDDGNVGFPGTIYHGYAFDPAADDVVTMTLSGLTAGATYNLAGYAGEGSPVTFAASTSGTATGLNTDPSVFSLGNNYATFTGVADLSGVLTVTATPDAGNIIRFSGLSIESVPEPATCAILGLGALALIIIGRNRFSPIG